jgi:hypothetical protein
VLYVPANALTYFHEGDEMTENSIIVDFLVRSLRQVDPRPLIGSELAVLLKAAHPEFSPETLGYRNLRDFIRREAGDITEAGRAGMDIQYSLRVTQARLVAEGKSGSADSISESALDQLTRDPRAWKTFTSPDSPFRLYLTDRGVLRSMHSSSKPLPEWREIQRISPESLLQIGKDFTADLDEIQKSVLNPTFHEPKWWFPFFDRLPSLGLKYKWVEFRRKRIREEFQARIGEIGVLPLAQAQAEALPLLALPAVASTEARSEFLIRKIAADVVQRMTDSELRNLNLPLGYVMDSLATR